MESSARVSTLKRNFILQQGFPEPSAASCPVRYSALLFQSLQPGGIALPRAPNPCRFAQGIGGTFALAIGVSLALGWNAIALALQSLLIVALGAPVFGGFCLGSFIFHLLSGRTTFAKHTLPWASGAS